MSNTNKPQNAQQDQNTLSRLSEDMLLNNQSKIDRSSDSRSPQQKLFDSQIKAIKQSKLGNQILSYLEFLNININEKTQPLVNAISEYIKPRDPEQEMRDDNNKRPEFLRTDGKGRFADLEKFLEPEDMKGLRDALAGLKKPQPPQNPPQPTQPKAQNSPKSKPNGRSL